jgi:hypothetical protein
VVGKRRQQQAIKTQQHLSQASHFRLRLHLHLHQQHVVRGRPVVKWCWGKGPFQPISVAMQPSGAECERGVPATSSERAVSRKHSLISTDEWIYPVSNGPYLAVLPRTAEPTCLPNVPMPIPKHVNDLGREQAVYMVPACEHMQGLSLHSHQRVKHLDVAPRQPKQPKREEPALFIHTPHPLQANLTCNAERKPLARYWSQDNFSQASLGMQHSICKPPCKR